jgi:hypothetical protein
MYVCKCGRRMRTINRAIGHMLAMILQPPAKHYLVEWGTK